MTTPSATTRAASLFSVTPPLRNEEKNPVRPASRSNRRRENQSEFLEEVHQMLVDVHAETAESDTDEQNARHAQRHPGDPDLAQHNAEGNDQRQNHHRVGDAAAPKRIRQTTNVRSIPYRIRFYAGPSPQSETCAGKAQCTPAIGPDSKYIRQYTTEIKRPSLRVL